METPQGYNATKGYIESLQLGKTHELSNEKGVEWKDPLRMFEDTGREVPKTLRYWLQTSEEDRLKFLKGYEFSRTKEDDRTWQRKIDVRWRDLAFVIGEETKAFTRPEFTGRGSFDVIQKALQLLLPAAPVRAKK